MQSANALPRGSTFDFRRMSANLLRAMPPWVALIGLLGAVEIMREPRILRAANPWYALSFFSLHGAHSFVVLGAVVLAKPFSTAVLRRLIGDIIDRRKAPRRPPAAE